MGCNQVLVAYWHRKEYTSLYCKITGEGLLFIVLYGSFVEADQKRRAQGKR
jgi:hypothetical protein